jgi:hypothetical protein
VATAYANLGDKENAVKSLDEAADLAADLPQPLLRASAFETVATHYKAYGPEDKAREMCGKALDAVTSIRDDGRRAAALASLSETFERTGMQFGEQERSGVLALLRLAQW